MPRFVLNRARAGATLLVVAGIVSLLLALSLAFLGRMRSDGEEIDLALREVQARIMLAAACDYVLEAGRLGWDTSAADPGASGSRRTWRFPPRMPARPLPPPNPPMTPAQAGAYHEEAFGWIDIRDGGVGPCTQDWDQDGAYDRCWDARAVEDGDGDGAPDRPAWPAIGSVARCVMAPMARPPSAISPLVAPNPIQSQDASAADFGLPLFRNPDPVPATATWAAFAAGDRRPRDVRAPPVWFRVFRDAPAGFVVTCGAGATRGYRDWAEVRGAAMTQAFGDEAAFLELRAAEVRTWWRIEWSGAVQAADYHLFDTDYFVQHWSGTVLAWDNGPFYHNDHYLQYPRNILSALYMHTGRGKTDAAAPRNFLGTIRCIERLAAAPTCW